MITKAQQSMINRSYVKNQLEKIDISASQSLKITDATGTQTHFIGLNDLETISMLIHYLLKRKEAIR